MDNFNNIKAGVAMSLDELQFSGLQKAVARTKQLSVKMNNATDHETTREILSEIIGQKLDERTIVFTPFHINLGIRTRIGKRVFINHACTFLDIGGITIEDDVQIGPNVNVLTEGHPLDPAERRKLIVTPVVIKRNAWIGAAATILPGVTVGENSVVAAGSVVTKDVPDNSVVVGIPAKVIKKLDF